MDFRQSASFRVSYSLHLFSPPKSLLQGLDILIQLNIVVIPQSDHKYTSPSGVSIFSDVVVHNIQMTKSQRLPSLTSSSCRRGNIFLKRQTQLYVTTEVSLIASFFRTSYLTCTTCKMKLQKGDRFVLQGPMQGKFGGKMSFVFSFPPILSTLVLSRDLILSRPQHTDATKLRSNQRDD